MKTKLINIFLGKRIILELQGIPITFPLTTEEQPFYPSINQTIKNSRKIKINSLEGITTVEQVEISVAETGTTTAIPASSEVLSPYSGIGAGSVSQFAGQSIGDGSSATITGSY